VLVGFEVRGVGACDERRATGIVARIDRDRPDLDELAVLRAALVANLGAMREQR
jgi:hypothetical protein